MLTQCPRIQESDFLKNVQKIKNLSLKHDLIKRDLPVQFLLIGICGDNNNFTPGVVNLIEVIYMILVK